ncbi:MAG: carbohydrate ABC transporter permease [Anaerolineales bacterium]|nr:carbohydrate ABC transporter permease [Anaerolineales bacterium]
MSELPAWSRKKRTNTLVNLALIIIVLVAMIPIATTILISFKQQADITRKPPIIFPCDTETSAFELNACRWAVEGYERVLGFEVTDEAALGFKLMGNMIRIYIPNTILYASVSALLVSLIAGLSGYAFSRYRFRGHRALMVAIYAITGVPILTNLLAIYQMGINLRKALPIWDERLYLIFIYLGFFLPISVWIMKGFIDAIPVELEEAALIEGCNPLGALFRVTVPLAMPGMVSVFLMTFVNVWNEFIVAYLLVPENKFKPALFGLYDFLSQNIINLQVLAAACIIIAAPMVVLFLFTRKTFFKAMVEGAVKG